ncbi:hypothetical protein C8R44DRAFT_579155, partial [Mycena epipterygia]
LFAAKWMYGSWDRLAEISAAIDVIDSVKASYQGTSHKTPDTSNLVWRITYKAKELNLNTSSAARGVNEVVKALVDILSAGEAILKSSGLAIFNENRRDLLKGIQVEEEINDMPPMELSLETPS